MHLLLYVQPNEVQTNLLEPQWFQVSYVLAYAAFLTNIHRFFVLVYSKLRFLYFRMFMQGIVALH